MNITNWFTGVVEDVNDPLQLGRVKARCFTYHTSSQTDIPTADLPWATCIMPVTNASISGIGQSATGLMSGSWVFGFFRDGTELQDPVILGSIPSTNPIVPGERGNGFADPHGSFPNRFSSDIPAGSTSYGFSNNDSFRGQTSLVSQFNSTVVGSGTTASTLHGPTAPIVLNGNASKIIDVARGEVGVTETSNNQGTGIAKYWGATDFKNGYSERRAWCAAFVCWCVQQSGIFSEQDRPKSAAAFKGGGYEAWARTKSPKVALTMNPVSVKAGQLVIFSFSHIGIVTADSDIHGTFRTIEGNTTTKNGDGVGEKSRKMHLVKSSISIG